MKENKIQGINVTVPFKKVVIPFLDRLSDTAKRLSIGKYNFQKTKQASW